ncbi:hypothetical protein [Nocardia otitidiscaviarum]|uniref:hypothetical protein n=1 Tax=Nocardia otitidiscaviarum TaxID=1823 RepID=UPI0004A6D66C|nr:hypothetical protein [Nocardia otitidiscaviarum]
MADRDLHARGRTLLGLVKPEHLEVIASEGPSALVRRLNTSLGVAELLRWFAENAAELLAERPAPAWSPLPEEVDTSG